MSVTHLLLEGESLPPLLEQARTLGGRVVQAERVRRGRSFFAGPGRYEIKVEFPSRNPRALVGNDGRRAIAARPEGGGGPTAVAAEPRPPEAVPAPPRPPRDPDVPDSLADLLFGFESAPRAATTKSPVRADRPRHFAITAPHTLRALGVPEALVPATASLTEALEELMVRVAPARPLAQDPGQVIALVGATEDALDLCAQMLRRIAAPVQLAHVRQADWPGGGHILSGPESARDLREQARDALVLAVIPTRSGRVREGARAVLRSLEPTQVWATVDALRPADELREELAALSASVPVSALAVRNARVCSRPGALLGLGHPIGWLDRRPATQVAWLRLLHQCAAMPVPEASIGWPTG